MSSDSRDSVQKSLRILCEANSLPDFQAIWYVLKIDTYQSVFQFTTLTLAFFLCFRLGDLIASNNAAREEEMTLLRRPSETQLSPPSSPRHQVSMLNSRNSVRSGGLDHVPVKIAVPPKNAHNDANIESLIEKMKSGLEVCLISTPYFNLSLLHGSFGPKWNTNVSSFILVFSTWSLMHNSPPRPPQKQQ